MGSQTQLIIVLVLGGLGLWFLSCRGQSHRRWKEGISFSGYGYRGQRCRSGRPINPLFDRCSPSPGPNRNWDFNTEACQRCLLTNEECVNGQVWCEDCLEACSTWIG